MLKSLKDRGVTMIGLVSALAPIQIAGIIIAACFVAVFCIMVVIYLIKNKKHPQEEHDHHDDDEEHEHSHEEEHTEENN